MSRVETHGTETHEAEPHGMEMQSALLPLVPAAEDAVRAHRARLDVAAHEPWIVVAAAGPVALGGDVSARVADPLR